MAGGSFGPGEGSVRQEGLFLPGRRLQKCDLCSLRSHKHWTHSQDSKGATEFESHRQKTKHNKTPTPSWIFRSQIKTPSSRAALWLQDTHGHQLTKHSHQPHPTVQMRKLRLWEGT